MSLFGARGSWAQDAERLAFHGFGGWAFGQTDNENRFGYIASEDGDWNNYYFALNVAAKPTEKIAIRAQAFWGEDQRGRRITLDHAFAEWTHSPAFKLRVGKTPVPFGIYTEVYDVGTVRPFYLLPQFYEGPLGLIPKSYVGGGLTGTYALNEDWDLQYDAFGGEIRFEPFSTDFISGIDPETGLPNIRTLDSQLVGQGMIGGRVLLASPAKGFDVGGTVFHAQHIKQSIEGGELVPYSVTDGATFVNARAQYQRKGFAARGEWFGALARDADVKSFYFEASQKLGGHWQVAAQYENSKIELPDSDQSIPEALRHHESFGLALNYWVSPNLVLKLNGYAIDGNMIAQPLFAGLKAAIGTIDESTAAVVVGAQFSF
jgi:hypothetical protein